MSIALTVFLRAELGTFSPVEGEASKCWLCFCQATQ